MTRLEIEKKLSDLKADIIGRIQKEPVKACAFSLLAGVIITLFQALFVPVIVIAAILLFALWYLSDPGEGESSKSGS